MNSIALALIELNPLNPTSGACAATTAPPPTSEARRFLLTSQTVWAAEGVFFGMIRTSNEEVAEPSTILLTHLPNFLRVTL